MDTPARFQYLLREYLHGNISASDHHELFALIDTGLYDDLLEESIVLSLQQESLPGADMAPSRAERLVTNILLAEEQAAKVVGISSRRNKRRLMMAAAVILALLISGAAWFFLRPDRPYNNPLAIISADSISQKNNNSTPMRLQLPDGTAVILQPGAGITYAKKFAGEKREISLAGEAFFEISKSAATPFLVYSNNIVTQVLGTSFSVRQDPESGQVEVNVRTGKVQVYENPALLAAGEPAGKSIILTPNQKGIYRKDKREFETTLVEMPEPLVTERHTTNSPAPHFVFDNKPMGEVLAALETTYGIEIIAENESLYHCVFTGDVTEQSLYTKLDIITRVINATYEIQGTKILIKGSGCK